MRSEERRPYPGFLHYRINKKRSDNCLILFCRDDRIRTDDLFNVTEAL